jgi:hypothetical protein
VGSRSSPNVLRLKGFAKRAQDPVQEPAPAPPLRAYLRPLWRGRARSVRIQLALGESAGPFCKAERRLPQPRRFVQGAGDNQPAVGRERHRPDPARVPGQGGGAGMAGMT